MSVLFLDLGTTSGYAWRTDGGAIVSGVWDLRPQRFEGGGMRFLRFREYLNRFHNGCAVKRIFFEEVRRHRGVDAAHIYGGLLGCLTGWCEEKAIPYQGIGVGAIKKSWTGFGNAPKDDAEKEKRNLKARSAKKPRKEYVGTSMIGEAWKRGYQPADDNEADAIAGLTMVTAEGFTL